MVPKPKFQKFRYRGDSVRETLTKMKDLSEQVIDLSYSAILFQCKDFSDEVLKLNEEIDSLLFRVRLAAILGARNRRDAESMIVVLQIASSVERMAKAASEMVGLLDLDVEAIPFLPLLLTQADERIRVVRLEKDIEAVEKSLGELQLENRTGMHVLAVQRRKGGTKTKRWIYEIDGDFVLKKGDTLVVRGTEEGYQILADYFEKGIDWAPPIEEEHKKNGGEKE